jgi:hypothetical protein
VGVCGIGSCQGPAVRQHALHVVSETGKCSTFYSLAHPNSLICARLFLLRVSLFPLLKFLSYVLLHVFVYAVLTSQSYGTGLVVCGIIFPFFFLTG